MSNRSIDVPTHTQYSVRMSSSTRFRVIDFADIPGVECPCGTARRAFADDPVYPSTVHRTDIVQTAMPHYHKTLTELYYIISCEPGTVMQLGDEQVPLHAEMLILVPPNTVHRVIGTAKVLISVTPKFDPHDEFVLHDPVR